MNEFQEQILEHYKNPHNVGLISWTPTNHSKSSNLSCGDEIEVKLLIKDGIIKDVNFVGEGCSISIASASIFTDMLKGKSLEEVKLFKFENLLEILGIELTPTRQRCAMLIFEAVDNALNA